MPQEFYKMVNKRRAEIDNILDHSGIHMDCSFVEKSGEDTFLYIFLKVENPAAAKKTLNEQKSDVYQYIQETAGQFIDSFESIDPVAIFDRIEKRNKI